MAKKNIHKIPKDLQKKIDQIKVNEIVAGCVVKFKAIDIREGKLDHLGISLSDSGLIVPSYIIPSVDQGKYSERNINGFELVRKDLPKETHYNSIESPNWGDSYNGTHTVNLPYQKYRRDFQPPRELEIIISCKDIQAGLPSYIISFRVQEILNKNSEGFKDSLFENLNLLQENVGAIGVEAANLSISDYAKSLNVSWEILPSGSLNETLQRVFRGKTPTMQQKDITTERYNFFQSLKPQSLVFGQSGFRRYFGALLEENLVVFENVEYGNAIYILFDNWEELSKLSRLDLLSGRFNGSFERVIHSSEWESKVQAIVMAKRKVIKKKN